MKTTKLILVALLMVFATTGFSQTEDVTKLFKQTPPNLEVKISLTNAMQNVALVSAMRSQLNPQFLNGQLRVYTVRVRLGQTVYHIWGTYQQWKYFFSVQDLDPKLH